MAERSLGVFGFIRYDKSVQIQIRYLTCLYLRDPSGEACSQLLVFPDDQFALGDQRHRGQQNSSVFVYMHRVVLLGLYPSLAEGNAAPIVRYDLSDWSEVLNRHDPSVQHLGEMGNTHSGHATATSCPGRTSGRTIRV